jgi:hypothetical protein
MFYYGDPPPLGMSIFMIILLLVLLFFVSKCDRDSFNETWYHKTVLINAVQVKGIVEGGGTQRGGTFLHIRLENGNIITLKTDEVTILQDKMETKKVQIHQLQAEIEAKQIELKNLKETK